MDRHTLPEPNCSSGNRFRSAPVSTPAEAEGALGGPTLQALGFREEPSKFWSAERRPPVRHESDAWLLFGLSARSEKMDQLVAWTRGRDGAGGTSADR